MVVNSRPSVVCRGRQGWRGHTSARHEGISQESRVEAVETMAANFTVLTLTGFITHIRKAEPHNLDTNSTELSCCRPGLLTEPSVSPGRAQKYSGILKHRDLSW